MNSFTKSFVRSSIVLTAIFGLSTLALAADDVWDGGTSGSSGSFLTATSWTGDVLPATTDNAIFAALGTGTTIGISFSGTTNNGSGSEVLNSLQLTALNTHVRTFNNSSSSVDGTLTLNGSGGILLANLSGSALTLSNGSTRLMNVVFGSAGSVNATGTITINSALSGSGFTKIGNGTLNLTNSNTYAGGTLISAGVLNASHDGALGTGDVSLTAGGVTLTLGGGVTQDYISDSATFSILSGDTVNLNYTVALPDAVASLIVNGVAVAPGLYGSSAINPDGIFTGTGLLLVVPEPSVYMLLGVGLLLCGQRFMRRKSA